MADNDTYSDEEDNEDEVANIEMDASGDTDSEGGDVAAVILSNGRKVLTAETAALLLYGCTIGTLNPLGDHMETVYQQLWDLDNEEIPRFEGQTRQPPNMFTAFRSPNVEMYMVACDLFNNDSPNDPPRQYKAADQMSYRTWLDNNWLYTRSNNGLTDLYNCMVLGSNEVQVIYDAHHASYIASAKEDPRSHGAENTFHDDIDFFSIIEGGDMQDELGDGHEESNLYSKLYIFMYGDSHLGEVPVYNHFDHLATCHRCGRQWDGFAQCNPCLDSDEEIEANSDADSGG